MARAQYQQYLNNKVTGETVLIKSNDYLTFQSKLEKKTEQWEKQNERFKKQEDRDKGIKKALEMTEQAKKEIEAYKNILKFTLKVDDKINWEELFDKNFFKEYVPSSKPNREEFEKNVPKSNIFEFISFIKNRRLKAEEEAKKTFEKVVLEREQREKQQVVEYEKKKEKYLENQSLHNKKLEKIRKEYEGGIKVGVTEYISLVLERSKYPETLNLFPNVNYEENAKILVVDMDLPADDKVVSTVECKYDISTQEIIEKKMGKKEFEGFYNDVLYQITLRTIHEIYESDYSNKVELVVFNGWVEKIDQRVGKEMKNCIISLQVSKKEFLEISLGKIDPRECFRHLKGIVAGSLVNLAPVKPIMTLNTEDKRFVEARELLGDFDTNTNLAVMDWQDFEVLIRDLIQKEFSREGCKVEVTRASRDAGVDAIAFDEDPIRGGKYVIQAKRYNNLVPLSAVRDLYGTVHNEGAVKGILVTTSHYGGDAIEFVKDKPLTLINGEQLLYMFNKHGYNMKIELTKKQKATSSISY